MDLISKFYNSDSEEEIKQTQINKTKTEKKGKKKEKENKDNSIKSNNISKNNLKDKDKEKDSDINQEKSNPKAEEIFNDIENKISLLQSAPLVNVDDLLNDQAIKKYEKFNSGNFVPLKPNHLTGYINYHKLNDFNFNEQYYNFNAL